MNAGSILCLIPIITTLFFLMQTLVMNTRLKRLEKFFGRDFIQVITRGGDGILLAVIDETRDGDFVFVPYYKKDDQFIHVEFRESNGDKTYHYKIAKKDTFTLRNRIKMAIVLRESARALNPKHLATFSNLDDETKKELLEDYEHYHALKETYNKLTKKLALTHDTEQIKEITEEMKKIREEMVKLKEKWKEGIVQEIDREKVLIVDDEDSPYIRIYRTIDLDEIDDTVTGVHPTEIYNTAMRMFLDWYQEALREFGRAMALTKARMQQASLSKWILFLGAGLIGMMFFLRMLGGG